MAMCRICQTRMSLFDVGEALEKYSIKYYICPTCGFVQTEDSYWLDEAYSDAIADTDIGLFGRNVGLCRLGAAICSVCLPDCRSALDFGGGYGMFVF